MNRGSAEPGFEGFYRANFSRLVSQMQRTKRLGFHDAEDIVQASFAELAPQWEQAENPAALLATIMHRKTIRHWEQQPFAKGVSTAYIGEDAERLHSSAQDPAVSVEHIDALRHLNRELRLEPIEQDIVLGRAQGLTTAEIANKAEISAAQVRQIGRRLKQRATAVATPVPHDPRGTMDSIVMAHIKRLPPRQRVVMAWAVRGYRPVSIASALEITANDARVNLAHARKAMAAMNADVALDAETLIVLRRTMRGRACLPSRSIRDQFSQAVHELAEAAKATHPYDRFLGAYMAALRASVAVVVARPVAPAGSRITRGNVWNLLYRVGPELADWAAYFASSSTRRDAAAAGLPDAVSDGEAADLVRESEVFLGLVTEMLGIPYLVTV